MNKAEWGEKEKYRKCEHWSREAKELWIRNPDLPISKKPGEKIVHEHVVPNKVICERLIQIRRKSRRKIPENEIKELLEKFCHACVITRDEDNSLREKHLRQKMPDNWDWDNNSAWARYLAVKIEVGKIKDADPQNWGKILSTL
jgi:hypothetical protein